VALVNGRLPDSILAPIPGGARMRKDAAAQLNTENFRLRAQGRGTVYANGSLSGYRTYAGQVLMRQQWCARGKCGNAAIPGTSNHGWGIAIDTNQAYLLDGHGGPFDKRYSDAPWESWHRRDGRVSQTGYTPPAPPKPRSPYSYVARAHGKAPWRVVLELRRLLRAAGQTHVSRKGWFGVRLARQVRKFQRAHHLKADGVVGPKTWAALRNAARNHKK
jgi:hypothetical protein